MSTNWNESESHRLVRLLGIATGSARPLGKVAQTPRTRISEEERRRFRAEYFKMVSDVGESIAEGSLPVAHLIQRDPR